MGTILFRQWVIAASFLFYAIPIIGQTPAGGLSDGTQAGLRFQVATIKPSGPDESRRIMVQGNRFSTTATTVVDLLKFAYGIHEQEIIGGPNWLRTQKFDLLADSETQVRPSGDEYKTMLQELLNERFKLAAHREMRELSVFEIVAAKNGPKLQKSNWPQDRVPTVGYSPGQLSAANATLTDVATFLQRFVTDRPVFDTTGIKGRYDLTLQWSVDEMQAAGVSRESDANSRPGFFTAIQEQLGLRLQKRKRLAPVFVIDSIDLPSAN